MNEQPKWSGLFGIDPAFTAPGEANSDPGNEPHIHVKKYGHVLPMSYEMAIDYGVMTEDEALARGWTPPPPLPPLQWRRRLRMWWLNTWHKRPRIHLGPCDHSDCGY